MHNKQQFKNPPSRIISCATRLALAVTSVLALTAVLTQSAQSQTFTILHGFSGGRDGGSPWAGLTMDRAGNLYGTTETGGVYGYGTVFKLKPTGSGWLFMPLYSFAGGDDGNNPQARVIFGPNGTVYGTTVEGLLVSASPISNFTQVLASERALAKSTKTEEVSNPFRMESRKSTPGSKSCRSYTTRERLRRRATIST